MLVISVPAARGAQEPEPPAPFVRVAQLTPWVAPDRPFTARIQISNTNEVPLDDVVVRITFHPRVITRSEIRAALDFGPTGAVVTTIERSSPKTIAPGRQRTIKIREDIGGRLTARGPYPIAITVTHNQGTVQFNSIMPFFPPTEAGRLNVSWVVPIGDTSAIPPGTVDATAIEALDLERTTELLGVIAARAPAPVTLAPSPAFIETVGDLTSRGITGSAGEALAALRRAVATVAEVASVPYAPVNLPALVAQGPEGDLHLHLERGAAVIEQLAGRSPTPQAFVPPSLELDVGSLQELARSGIGGTVISAGSLRTTPSEPTRLLPDQFGPLFSFTLNGSGIEGVLPDPDIRARIESSPDGALLAQAIIAETLGVWQELPLYAPDRTVTLVTTPQAPTALAAALDGLAKAPWITLQPLSRTLARLGADDRVAPTRGSTDERSYLSVARAALAALDGIVVEPLPDRDELERAILLAESDTWRDDPAAGVALAAAVTDRVEQVTGSIDVAQRTVTLTSRIGDVPLTVVNDNPFPVRVRVRLAGTKIAFPEGESQVRQLTPGDNTFSFPVEARAAGAFPLDVLIEAPDGQRRLATGRLVVRSTVVSAVSLAIVGGSALFLLAAWVRRAVRADRRRARDARTDGAPHAGSTPAR